ncbi:MAG: DUF3048 domain-containing protein [Clostridia bacterium]|nr:DUF3048 domain-containing protein [Clostridia bacterium]
MKYDITSSQVGNVHIDRGTFLNTIEATIEKEVSQDDHILRCVPLPRNEVIGMKKFIIFFLLICMIGAGGYLGYKYYETMQTIETDSPDPQQEEIADDPVVVELEPEPVKTVEIFKGTERPIAVMIDNNKNAWPQSGLNDAYLVYEIIVEGGETRLMACFKGANLEKIGPIRSSRHYFLDYAMENDAIYVHFGWSPQAESDIASYGINNVNGLIESSKTFWRVKDKSAPHNAVTNTEKILEVAAKRKYRTESDFTSVLNYVVDEVELTGGIMANEVTIPYSTSNKVKYEYNPETKMYTRYSKGKKQTDWITKEDVTTKNIIITKADNYTLTDKENKGRQGIKNIGTLDGYYITNGMAIPITCTKNSRTSKTEYKDLEGNIIEVNDGRTFIQICPLDSNILIEPGDSTNSVEE